MLMPRAAATSVPRRRTAETSFSKTTEQHSLPANGEECARRRIHISGLEKTQGRNATLASTRPVFAVRTGTVRFRIGMKVKALLSSWIVLEPQRKDRRIC